MIVNMFRATPPEMPAAGLEDTSMIERWAR
jgi:hypothetical protein